MEPKDQGQNDGLEFLEETTEELTYSDYIDEGNRRSHKTITGPAFRSGWINAWRLKNLMHEKSDPALADTRTLFEINGYLENIVRLLNNLKTKGLNNLDPVTRLGAEYQIALLNTGIIIETLKERA
jgi:hypothetical protein